MRRFPLPKPIIAVIPWSVPVITYIVPVIRSKIDQLYRNVRPFLYLIVIAT